MSSWNVNYFHFAINGSMVNQLGIKSAGPQFLNPPYFIALDYTSAFLKKIIIIVIP